MPGLRIYIFKSVKSVHVLYFFHKNKENKFLLTSIKFYILHNIIKMKE